MVNHCQYDASDCEIVKPGHTCEIRCLSPYRTGGTHRIQATPATGGSFGGSVTAFCPGDNAVINTTVTWTPPDCNLRRECDDKWPVPAWLELDGNYLGIGGWNRYNCKSDVRWNLTGTVKKYCDTTDDCSVEVRFTGCTKMVYCMAKDERTIDACRYDVSGCSSVYAGHNCSIGCLAPYKLHGATTVAACKHNNIDPTRQLEITSYPKCEMDCPFPTITPAGYKRITPNALYPIGYKCANGWAGTPSHTCEIDRVYKKFDEVAQGGALGVTQCNVKSLLQGCKQLVACAPMKVSTPEGCQFDVSRCRKVWPGLTCKVYCRSPDFSGGPYTDANNRRYQIARCEDANNRSNDAGRRQGLHVLVTTYDYLGCVALNDIYTRYKI